MPQIASFAGLGRRLLACAYELLLLIAIWLLCTAVFMLLAGNADTLLKRSLLQFFMWLITGFYFVRCWCRSGQTLAAQTWRIQLVNRQCQLLSFQEAIGRYLLLSIFTPLCGVNFIWALVDKDQQFLHDCLMHTRLIKQP